jgi:hypothetical protein
VGPISRVISPAASRYTTAAMHQLTASATCAVWKLNDRVGRVRLQHHEQNSRDDDQHDRADHQLDDSGEQTLACADRGPRGCRPGHADAGDKGPSRGDRHDRLRTQVQWSDELGGRPAARLPSGLAARVVSHDLRGSFRIRLRDE